MGSFARDAQAENWSFASTIQGARWQRLVEGGCVIVLPAVMVTGGKLKQVLDSRFPGEYSVQVLASSIL